MTDDEESERVYGGTDRDLLLDFDPDSSAGL